MNKSLLLFILFLIFISPFSFALDIRESPIADGVVIGASGFVPYNGARGNLNMGIYNVTAAYFFGNGSGLWGINGSQVIGLPGDTNASTECSAGEYLSGSGTCDTLLTEYINLSGTNANQDVNISPYNLTTRLVSVARVLSDNFDDTYIDVGRSTDSAVSFTVSDQLLLNITTDAISYGEDLIPDSTATRDLGRASLTWNNIWAENINATNFDVGDNGSQYLFYGDVLAIDPRTGTQISVVNLWENITYDGYSSAVRDMYVNGTLVAKRLVALESLLVGDEGTFCPAEGECTPVGTNYANIVVINNESIPNEFQGKTIFADNVSFGPFDSVAPNIFRRIIINKDGINGLTLDFFNPALGGVNNLSAQLDGHSTQNQFKIINATLNASLHLIVEGNITTDNITATYFIGNGSLLTDLPAQSNNPFNQSLNTTDDVTFNNVSLTGNLSFDDEDGAIGFWPDNFIMNKNLLDKTTQENITNSWSFQNGTNSLMMLMENSDGHDIFSITTGSPFDIIRTAGLYIHNGSFTFQNLDDTIAGIENQNLVDKTANEFIEANWTFNGTLNVSDESNFYDQMTVSSGNGKIVTTGGSGAISAQTEAGQAGAISFGNTADIGISQDGVSNGYDYDGSMIFKQKASNPDGLGEFIFIEETGSWRFALPSSGANYGSYNPRSFIIAGPSWNNGSNFNCSLWGFGNLDCDASGTGADLGVQDDLQVLGTVFVNDSIQVRGQSFFNSTTNPTVTINGSTGTDSPLEIIVSSTKNAIKFSGDTAAVFHNVDGSLDFRATGSAFRAYNFFSINDATAEDYIGFGTRVGGTRQPTLVMWPFSYRSAFNWLDFTTVTNHTVHVNGSLGVSEGVHSVADDNFTITANNSLHFNVTEVMLGEVKEKWNNESGTWVKYSYDTERNKWLSVSEYSVGFGRNAAGVSGTDFRMIQSVAMNPATPQGYPMPFNGTLTGWSARASNTPTVEIQLFADATVLHNETWTASQQSNMTLNGDFSQTDQLTFTSQTVAVTLPNSPQGIMYYRQRCLTC